MSWLKRIGRRIKLASRVIRGLSAPLPLLSPVLTQYPVLVPLRELYEQLTRMVNKYDVYRTLTEIDPELYGAINKLALMTAHSYKGVGVAIGRELEEREQRLLHIVEEFERRWNLRGLFYSVAFHLLRDGDDIYVIKLEDDAGLTGMKPLPIPFVTIVENEEQIGDVSAQVFEPNIYILNELSEPIETPEGKHQV